MAITPEYTRKAVQDYQKRIDKIIVLTPAGTKERIRAAGIDSASGYCRDLILQDLQRLEGSSGSGSADAAADPRLSVQLSPEDWHKLQRIAEDPAAWSAAVISEKLQRIQVT